MVWQRKMPLWLGFHHWPFKDWRTPGQPWNPSKNWPKRTPLVLVTILGKVVFGRCMGKVTVPQHLPGEVAYVAWPWAETSCTPSPFHHYPPGLDRSSLKQLQVNNSLSGKKQTKTVGAGWGESKTPDSAVGNIAIFWTTIPPYTHTSILHLLLGADGNYNPKGLLLTLP